MNLARSGPGTDARVEKKARQRGATSAAAARPPKAIAVKERPNIVAEGDSFRLR